MKAGNTGGCLLPYGKSVCNDKNNSGKIQNFLKSTKTNSPTSGSGATSLPPIGDAFMYIETSLNNHGPNVFVSWERTHTIQTTNLTLIHKRFSILTNDNLGNLGRFRIQLLLEDNTWSTQYTISKNTQYSDNSTDCTLLNLNFAMENYGVKLVFDQIATAHSDMCFNKIIITHSAYKIS